MNLRSVLAFTAAAAVAAFAVACGGADPTVAVTIDNDTFTSGSTVALTVTVTDFTLRDPAGHAHSELTAAQHDDHGDHSGAELSADGGHYHVYLDTTDTNPLTMAWTETVMLPVTTTPGAHKLIVRLNNDGHMFLNPEVMAHVDVTVQ